MIGGVIAGVAAVAAGTGAGYLRWRAVGTPPDASPVWFEVHPPHLNLTGGPPDPVTLDAAMRARFAAGLRLPETGELMVATAPIPRPTDPAARSYVGFAALQQPGVRYRVMVGVPGPVAHRVPFAAAACGLLARPSDAAPPGLRTVPDGVPVVALALPAWIVGTDDAGRPVTVNLPPGATVLVTGPGAGTLARTCLATGRRGPDVAVVGCTSDGWKEAWRAAWHPQCCRLLVDESGSLGGVLDGNLDGNEVTDGAGNRGGSCPVPVDLTVRLGDRDTGNGNGRDAGNGGGQLGNRWFRPLPLRI